MIMKSSLWKISEQEKKSILSLVTKGKEEERHNERFAIFSFEDMYNIFSDNEIAIFEKYLAFNPKELSKSLPFLGIKEPENLVTIRNQHFTTDKLADVPPVQYLPSRDVKALARLNKEIREDLGKELNVLYGYRSPARQVFLFFDHLNRTFHFDFDAAIKRVFPPHYSEHASGVVQGIDFITQDGIKGDGFEKTTEYAWLTKNAKEFGFVESYPKNNVYGVVWESWHWKYIDENSLKDI